LKAGTIEKIFLPILAGALVGAGIFIVHSRGSAPPAIRNLEALYITSSNATLEAEYSVENQWSNAEIRFGYKKENSSVWSYTDWRGISGNGTLDENINNLTLTTNYEFKAVIQHGSEEISSPIHTFETYSIPLTYEADGTIDYTIDGDTVQVTLTWVNPSTTGVHTGSGQNVRFSGGMNAPELTEVGGQESKAFVRDNFCSYQTEVFLDLDNQSSTPYHDVNGRLLGVVYVKKNGRWVNVNAEVLRWGMKTYPDHDWLPYRNYPSEFNPDQWLENDYPYILENFV
jgi:endonuclease YncB( thermonuclease family)